MFDLWYVKESFFSGLVYIIFFILLVSLQVCFQYFQNDLLMILLKMSMSLTWDLTFSSTTMLLLKFGHAPQNFCFFLSSALMIFLIFFLICSRSSNLHFGPDILFLHDSFNLCLTWVFWLEYWAFTIPSSFQIDFPSMFLYLPLLNSISKSKLSCDFYQPHNCIFLTLLKHLFSRFILFKFIELNHYAFFKHLEFSS